MADSIPWLLIAVGALIVILALLFWYWKKGKMHETDYRAWFYIGLVWLAVGIIPGNSFFFIMGLVFVALGLMNKSKWKKQKKWSQLSKDERNRKLIMIGAMLVLLLLVLAVYFLERGG